MQLRVRYFLARLFACGINFRVCKKRDKKYGRKGTAWGMCKIWRWLPKLDKFCPWGMGFNGFLLAGSKGASVFPRWDKKAPLSQWPRSALLLGFFRPYDNQLPGCVDNNTAFFVKAQLFQPFPAQGKFGDYACAHLVKTVFGLDFKAPCLGPFDGILFIVFHLLAILGLKTRLSSPLYYKHTVPVVSSRQNIAGIFWLSQSKFSLVISGVKLMFFYGLLFLMPFIAVFLL